MPPSATCPRRRASRAWRLTAALGAGTWLAAACARSPRAVQHAADSGAGTTSPPASPRPAVADAGAVRGDSLTGRRWTLVELDGRAATPALGAAAPYIRLRPDTARLEGNTGCNGIFARYERGGGDRLRFAQLGGTLRACADSAPADQERRFMAALAATRRYAIRGDTLTLFDDAAMRARLATSDR